MRVNDLVERFGGTVEGDSAIEVADVTGVEFAGPNDATFATDEALLAEAEASPARCVIVPPDLRASETKTLIRCDAPNRYVAQLLTFFHPPAPVVAGVHPSATVADGVELDESASLGPNASIGAGCKIGRGVRLMANVCLAEDCVVGDDTIIYPNVTVYAHTRIGARVAIHAGTVIGSDGFGYFPDSGGLANWPHVGNVVIEDDVEIGANTCIDRAKFGTTLIEQGAKIDNLVQIAHNCRVGRWAILAGQAALSGSVVLEDGVVLGGRSGCSDHVTVGRGAKLAACAVAAGDVAAGTTQAGFPCRPVRQWLQEVTTVTYLTENRKPLRKLINREAPGA
ncbi:MAG: UDP-3-O-(3-hydroxymyristoyl)glucosamine N-acyltransferase [bacterium]|nr:UDP-3-O-(3-hydroxymyristoyl)glucosamine N-acyltransferase [bacterium]